jgi:cohesin complex subunit SA-1/2
MSEFMERLFRSAADAELFQDDDFLQSITAWLSAKSSSTLRTFRHTATFAALSSMTHVNKIASEAQHEFRLITRQRDVEKKKARVDKGRLKDLERRVAHSSELCATLDRFLEDMFNR